MKLSLFLHGRTGDIPEGVVQLADETVAGDRLERAFSDCTGDWILSLGPGRTLNDAWNRCLLNRLMSERAVTHYFFPERFLLDSKYFAATNAYVGRFALGLWRNIESIAVPSAEGQELVLAGEPVYVAGPFVDAAAAHPGADVERQPVDDACDVRIMAPTNGVPLTPGIHVRCIRAPIAMTPGRTYWTTIRISNNGTRALLPQSEFVYRGNLALTYRWVDAGGSPVGKPASGIPFPARILPGYEHDALLAVRAPDSGGTFYLQPDIVEEKERYFSACEYGTYETQPVEVAAHG